MGRNGGKIRTTDCEKTGRVAAAMVLRSIMNAVQERKVTIWWREEGATVKFGDKSIMWLRFMAQYVPPLFTSCIIMALYPKGPSHSSKDESVPYLVFDIRFVQLTTSTTTTGRCRRVIFLLVVPDRSSHSPKDMIPATACGIGWHLCAQITHHCVRYRYTSLWKNAVPSRSLGFGTKVYWYQIFWRLQC